jgi:hypothetical protein
MTCESTAWMLAVYDGRTCIGFLLKRGKAGVEGYDRDSKSLGIFPSQSEAAGAITVGSTH